MKFTLFAFAAFAIVVPGCSGCCGTSGSCTPTPLHSYDGGSPPPYPVYDGGRPPPVYDAGHDAGPDGGPEMFCFTGLPCDAVRGCNGGQVCETLPSSPLTAYYPDGGTTTIDDTLYLNGYCTNATLGSTTAIEGMAGACNVAAASDVTPGMDGCLLCAKCVRLPFQRMSPTDPPYVQCMQRCTPSATDSGGCRMGYSCDAATHTCEPFGCQNDLDCRLLPEDTNADGVFDTTAGDRYLVDVASTATCNMVTGRCQSPPTPLARAGDTCTRSSTCELDGECLDELTSHWPGGYCTRRGCDVPGRECPTPDKCQDVGARGAAGWAGSAGDFRCMKACTVGAEDASLVLGPGGHGDTCRAGYACVYDGRSLVSATANGACEPGNYDVVTTNDVGAACTSDADCFSPHGLGACIFASPSSCTIMGCAGFPDAAAICGTGNSCVTFSDSSSACLRTCATAADCAAAGAPPSYGCLPVDTTHTVCWPACLVDTDCLSGHTCVGATMTSTGTCT